MGIEYTCGKAYINCQKGHRIEFTDKDIGYPNKTYKCANCNRIFDCKKKRFNCFMCRWDYCLDCANMYRPNPVEIKKCNNGHNLERKVTRYHTSYFTCAQCKRNYEDTKERWNCKDCNYDICYFCRPPGPMAESIPPPPSTGEQMGIGMTMNMQGAGQLGGMGINMNVSGQPIGAPGSAGVGMNMGVTSSQTTCNESIGMRGPSTGANISMNVSESGFPGMGMGMSEQQMGMSGQSMGYPMGQPMGPMGMPGQPMRGPNDLGGMGIDMKSSGFSMGYPGQPPMGYGYPRYRMRHPMGGPPMGGSMSMNMGGLGFPMGHMGHMGPMGGGITMNISGTGFNNFEDFEYYDPSMGGMEGQMDPSGYPNYPMGPPMNRSVTMNIRGPGESGGMGIDIKATGIPPDPSMGGYPMSGANMSMNAGQIQPGMPMGPPGQGYPMRPPMGGNITMNVSGTGGPGQPGGMGINMKVTEDTTGNPMGPPMGGNASIEISGLGGSMPGGPMPGGPMPGGNVQMSTKVDMGGFGMPGMNMNFSGTSQMSNTCPQGHILQKTDSRERFPTGMYSCSKCYKTHYCNANPPFTCAMCNYNLCMNCKSH